MEGAPNRHVAGKIRVDQNWIGGNDHNPCGADFVPPPPEEVQRLLADLCSAINADIQAPLMQAALVHAQFETIHPFADGNGRTGRALVHVILRRRGIAPRFLPPISVVFAGARDRYIEGLTRFRGDGVAAWIEQFSAATLKAAGLARIYIERVRSLQDSWRAKLRASGTAPRIDAAAWSIIEQMPGHPIISGPAATAATNRAKSRVYEGIAQLEKAGVLVPLSTSQRNQWWEATGLLDLIAELEAGELKSE
jgi:Fic family protein